jgi:hypothetical protein
MGIKRSTMAGATDYFHLSGAMLAVGSVIEPGSWGRVVRAWGWQHGQALREMALEAARLASHPEKPSRLDAAFALLTLDDARKFKAIQGFQQHIIYRVTLVNPNAASHLTDHRFCAPQGTIRPNWADIYWMEVTEQSAAVPGMDWSAVIGGVPLYEFLTLSRLKVKERID